MADIAYSALNNTAQIPQLMQQNQAAGNALKLQNLQQQSQANILATQVLSAASSTKNPQLYQSAKQHLSAMGLDTSMWPEDVNEGAQFAQAARLAQSPLGSLLNAAGKLDANQIAANTAAGKSTNDPNANAYAMLRGQFINEYGPQGGDAFDGLVKNGQVPGVSMPSSQPQPAQQQGSNQPPALPASAPGANIPVMQQAAAGQQPAPQQAASQQVIDANGSTPTQFVPPPRDPSMTQQAYQDAVANAQKAWESNPAVKAASAQGTKTGELTATDIESANKAQELTDRLKQNLLAMKAINEKVPSGGITSADWQSRVDRAYSQDLPDFVPGVKTAADKVDASGQWDQINNQQTISEIQQFMASGGSNTRINQTLDRMVQAASGIDKDLPASTRAKMIDNALAEIGNKSISAQNLAARQTGQPTQPYQAIPVNAGSPAQAAPVINYAPGLIRNGFVFKGGDPTQQSNWQKVQ